MLKQRINNERFTIRFCHTMDALGIRTVGQAYRFLYTCTLPNLKIGNTRVTYLRRELDIYINQNKEK